MRGALARLGAPVVGLALLSAATPVQGAPTPRIVTYPDHITAGFDGALWFTTGAGIGRMTPAGLVSQFRIPIGDGQLSDVAAHPGGDLWVAEFGGRVGRITQTGGVTWFPRGLAAPGYCECSGGRIAPGPDGNMWFTVPDSGGIGHVSPDGDYSIVVIVRGASPEDITAGPDGNMWFTDQEGGLIGRVTTAGVVTRFDGGRRRLAPWEIAAGADGNLWFTEPARGRIGRITPDGAIAEFPAAPDGRVRPTAIVAGPDGNMWFTTQPGDRIGRITPAGEVRTFPVPPPGGEGGGIAAGPDGNLWFTSYRSRLGRITPAGVASEFPPASRITSARLIGTRAVRARVRCPSGAAVDCRGVLRLETDRRLGPTHRVVLAPGARVDIELALAPAWRRQLASRDFLRIAVTMAPRLAGYTFLPGNRRSVVLRLSPARRRS